MDDAETGPVLGCACTNLRKAARAVTRVYDEALAPSGLTANQFAVLRALQRLGPTAQSRLAKELVMDRTSLYRSLGPLAREGWVRSRGFEGDRRVKVAELTPRGREKIRRTLPRWRRAQAAFVQHLGETAIADLARALGRALDCAAAIGCAGDRRA